MIKQLIIEHYQLIKALHIIAVICWMAGMLYLPRLFVYHATVDKSSSESKLLSVMEYRLLKYIMNPSLVATFIFGLLMIWALEISSFGKWLHVKLLLVFIMTGIHGLLSSHLKKFAMSTNMKSHVYFRLLNEIPTVLMIGIVLLAVLKPW